MTRSLARLAPLSLAFLAATAGAHDHTRERAEDRLDAPRAEVVQAIVDLPAGRLARLDLELIDARTGAPLPGLVRVTDPDGGGPYALDPADAIPRDRGWHAVPRGAAIKVPRARVRIEAFHGLETGIASKVVDLSGADVAAERIPLSRFADARARGLRSGNTHLHLMRLTRAEAERYLRDVPAADGLDVVFLSHLRRAGADRDYISNAFAREDLARLSAAGAVLYDNGEEHRHNFGAQGEGFGHVMFLGLDALIHPVSIGPGIMGEGTDFPPLRAGIRAARRAGSGVIWCHNTFGLEDIPSWLEGLLDAQNIFDGGEHGRYEDTFYRYLDLGMAVPFSTGTDWFITDFSRAYVPVEGGLTSRRWLDALAAGRSFITNGPLLEFEVDGRSTGETIALDAPRRLRIRGRAVGRADFRALELVVDGAVARSVPTAAAAPGDHFVAELDLEVERAGPGWLALRVPGDAGRNELGQPLFAHTSPIYVTMAGRRPFRVDAAERLRDELRRAIESIRERGTFADDAERDEVLGIYRHALRTLEDLIAGERRK